MRPNTLPDDRLSGRDWQGLGLFDYPLDTLEISVATAPNLGYLLHVAGISASSYIPRGLRQVGQAHHDVTKARAGPPACS